MRGTGTTPTQAVAHALRELAAAPETRTFSFPIGSNMNLRDGQKRRLTVTVPDGGKKSTNVVLKLNVMHPRPAEGLTVRLTSPKGQPINLDTLPANQSFVGSNETDSGTVETKQLCANWKAEGKSEVNVYVMEGELSNQAAVQRTKDIHDVIGGPDCGVKVNIIDEQTANWSRDKAQDLMTNWLSTNKPFDGVISNNDEMAIGAIQAMKAAGIDMKTVQVGGVDATQDALAAMQAGDLDVTVFQNAAAQGSGAVDAAVKLAKGDKVDRAVWVPFELVTPENVANYLKKN